MRCLIAATLIIFSFYCSGQCKTFRISSKGDTLDCVDMKGLKQGKWLVQVAPLRGEPGFEEEGVFINNRKEGAWRKYNLMGDLLAQENYKWGNKSGINRYFTIAGLEREESWRAVSPGKSFDTIDVQDLKDPNKYEKVVIKTDGSSYRQGVWKYFYPQTGYLIKTEKYMMDKLVEPGEEEIASTLPPNSDTTKLKADTIPKKTKTKEVLEFEKKTSGKKNKVRDGKTGN
jgi:hypothetical protein